MIRLIIGFIVVVLLTGIPNHIPDGSLLFVEGGNQIVMNYTKSVYSHVALIFNVDGEPYVYEATKPRCRKIKLKDYLDEISRESIRKQREITVWVMKPKGLTPDQTYKMQEYCEDQIGRKYNVNSFFSGISKKGIHCGELTGRAMMAGDMNIPENPCTLCPQDIYDIAPSYYHKAIRQ